MLQARGGLWTYLDATGFGGARVITTNGFVKANGQCVMDRGCAREAKERWPWLPAELGSRIREHGNRCFRFSLAGFSLVTFPVKPERGPHSEPGWQAKAELPLIEQSARQLVEMADRFHWAWVVLPQPGCGNGQLAWRDVRPLLGSILDDRFHAITWPHPGIDR